MSPGGHLVTTVAACTASVLLTRDLPLASTLALAGGIATGGFLIDVDHAIDYVLVERQRDLRPGAFLRYYVEGRVRRTVLVLHSYELFSILVAAALWLNCLALTGYVLGSLMHLALDLTFNAELTPGASPPSTASPIARPMDSTRVRSSVPRRFSLDELLGLVLRRRPDHRQRAGSGNDAALIARLGARVLDFTTACGSWSSRTSQMSVPSSATS